MYTTKTKKVNSSHDVVMIHIGSPNNHNRMGPSYDVPHMLLTFAYDSSLTATSSSCSLMADYVARGATPLGSDGQYLENFYGSNVQRGMDQGVFRCYGNSGHAVTGLDQSSVG